MKIRKAVVTDAQKLAVLAEATFRDAFSKFNTSENMDEFCKAHYSDVIQSKEIEDTNIKTIVAEKGGALVAYAQLRWAKAPDCVAEQCKSGELSGEIQRIYVDKMWHGKGLAHQLIEYCFSIFKQKNIRVVWLGVWEHNPRAIAFYKKFGFKEVGEHVFMVGDDRQRDIILVCELKA